MPRIGDTVRPELQRADTSGILKGAAIGAEAMGRGMAALGAGVGQGLQKRAELKNYVKQTSAQAKSLAEFLPDESPFKKMAQGAVDYFNDPENRFSEHLAMAKSLEPNLKMVQADLHAGIAKRGLEMQVEEQKAAASVRKGQALGLASAFESGGDITKLEDISKRVVGADLKGDPEAINAYRASAMQALLAQQKGTGGAITKLEQPFVGPDGKKYTRSAFQQGGKVVSEWTVVPDADVGTLGPDGQPLTEAEKVFNAAATKDLVPWASGGADIAQNEVDKLDAVLQAFDDGTIKTGPLEGTVIPDVIRAKTVKQREKVHSIIAKSIKELFGGNPSLAEVERLFQFAWNDQLPEAANREKVVALKKDLNGRIRIRNEQLKELRDTGFVLPRGGSPPVSEETEPVRPTRDVSEDDAAMLRSIQQRGAAPGSRVQPQVQPEAQPGAAVPVQPAAAAPVAASPVPPASPQPAGPVPTSFEVLTTPRDHAASRINLKDVKNVVSLDFNSGETGKPAPSPGIEAVVPKNAPAASVAKVKQYLKETETWLRSKGVKTAIRTRGKNKDGIIYEGQSPRFYYTEPFFKNDAASRKAIEKDPDGYARILARTIGTLPGVTFIPPHQVKGKGAVIPGTKISEQDWALTHVIPALLRLKK